MSMKWAVRAVTGLIVLCLATLGVLVWRDYHASRAPSVAGAAPAGPTLGEFTALVPPLPAPDLRFAARSGAPVRLADFRGRTVLVNLWATWCGPCIMEMPALDRLQAALGDTITIVAISEDRGGAAAVDPFLAKLQLKQLAVYLDPKNLASHAFAIEGLPTSLLIGPDGDILARLEGAAPWDSAAMVKLLERYARAGKPPSARG